MRVSTRAVVHALWHRQVVPNRYASMTVESMAAVLGTEGTTVDPITALEDAVKAGAEARQKDYKQSIVLGNLAVAYNMAKRHDEALNLEVKVMQLRERTLRPMHIDVLRAQVNAAVTLIFLQRYDDALEILSPALRKFRQCHEGDTWHPLAMLHTAKAQVSVKKHALAIDILEKALAHSAVERAMSSIGESKSVLTDLLDQARTHVQAAQVGQDTTKPVRSQVFEMLDCGHNVSLVITSKLLSCRTRRQSRDPMTKVDKMRKDETRVIRMRHPRTWASQCSVTSSTAFLCAPA